MISNKNSLILNINDKENEVEEYPLFEATCNNNVEIVKSLMDYVNKNNIILNINDKDKEYQHYPLHNAVAEGNNIEMVELLMNYANKKKNKFSHG